MLLYLIRAMTAAAVLAMTVSTAYAQGTGFQVTFLGHAAF